MTVFCTSTSNKPCFGKTSNIRCKKSETGSVFLQRKFKLPHLKLSSRLCLLSTTLVPCLFHSRTTTKVEKTSQVQQGSVELNSINRKANFQSPGCTPAVPTRRTRHMSAKRWASPRTKCVCLIFYLPCYRTTDYDSIRITRQNTSFTLKHMTEKL